MAYTPTKRKIQAAKTVEERVLITAQYAARQEMIALFAVAAAEIRRILQAAAGADGKIAPARLEEVTGEAGVVVQRLFVDRNDPRGRRVFGTDNQALSPYAAILNRWIAWSTRQIVKAQHNVMRRAAPDAVFRWLATTAAPVAEALTPGPSPKGEGSLIAEQVSDELREIAARLRIFEANPAAQYEPAHTWVDPNGYRLSDRIWRTGEMTRQRLDALVAEGIREGRSAVEIANLVERFMRPDRAGFRTKKPYGQDGSYDALRLARTEITRANGQAIMTAARANPYVYAMVWNLSPSHPEIDICDDHAAFNPYGINDPFPQYPAHPHCLCYITSRVDDPVRVTEDLMRVMDEARGELLPYLTPAQIDAFTQQLVGRQMAAQAVQAEGIAAARAGNIEALTDLRNLVRTANGLFMPDVGTPGDTRDSLAKFLDESYGPLAQAMTRDGYARRGEDGRWLIDAEAVKATARQLVVASQDAQYGRDYILSLVREFAGEQMIEVRSNDEAALLLNDDYAYRARALLRAARIHEVSLTEAQYRRLNQIAGGGYLDLVYEREGTERGTLTTPRGRGGSWRSGGWNPEEARRAENRRREFIENVVRGL